MSGTGRVEMKSEAAVTCVGGPCSFFLHSDGPFDIHYVDQNGTEIPAEQALNSPS